MKTIKNNKKKAIPIIAYGIKRNGKYGKIIIGHFPKHSIID
jgi:hypothetical protein